jgi:hypothetical protein
MPGTGVAAARQQRARSAQRALGDLVLSPFGPDWEIGSGPDVHKAVLAVEVGHAKGPREAAIKAWIYERAEELAAPDSVPASWKGNWKPTRSSAVTQARRAKRRV